MVLSIPAVVEGRRDTVKVGATICFESLFSGLVRHLPVLGAEMLVHLSDEGWYRDPNVWIQNTNLDVMRAVENRRSVVRVSNVGPSLIVDPKGRVREWIEGENGSRWQVSGWMVGEVELRAGTTLFSRLGDWATPASWMLLAVLLLRRRL